MRETAQTTKVRIGKILYREVCELKSPKMDQCTKQLNLSKKNGK